MVAPAGVGEAEGAGALLAVELFEGLFEVLPEGPALVPGLVEAVFPEAEEVAAAGVALAVFPATVGIELELCPPQATSAASRRKEIRRDAQERSTLGETTKRKTKLLALNGPGRDGEPLTA